MSENTTERLLPCSGRTLAEAIHSTARREYDEQRDLILGHALAIVREILNITEDEWIQVLDADHLFGKTVRGSGVSSNLQQSFKQICNSALMPVSSAKERTEQKLQDFFKQINMIRNSEFAKFDTRVAEIFLNIEKASHTMTEAELSHVIYQELTDLRRDKSGISNRMSRIRKVAEFVLEPDSTAARKLGETNLQDKNDASDWLFDVSRTFVESKQSSNKFVSSYEKPWYDLGYKVIERNELDVRQLAWRNSLRNVHLIEKMLTSSDEGNSWPSTDIFYNTLSDRTKYRLRAERSRYDFESEDVSMELKVSGKLYEAIFLLPPFASDFISELQIKLMEYVYKNHPDLELNVSASSRPSPTLRMSVTGLDIQRFGNLQLSVLKFVQNEVKKRR